MATQVQNRRGTTAEHSTFTGANGELTVDTTKRTLVVHDGSTAGGRPLLREDQSNLPTSAPTTGIYNASGSLAISTNGTKRIEIQADGDIDIDNGGVFYDATNNRLAIGTTTFESPAAGRQILEINGTSSTLVNLDTGGTRRAYWFTDATDTYLYNTQAGSLVFGSNNAERARIDSSGRLLVGTSTWSGSSSNVGGIQIASTNYVAGGQVTERLGSWTATASDNNGTCDAGIEYFRVPRGGGVQSGSEIRFFTGFSYLGGTFQRMTIDQNGTITFNAYGAGTLATNASGVISASDGRYKTKTRQIENGLEAITALNPTYYKWNEGSPFASEHEELGFVAQEVAAVIPEASPGEDEEGKYRNYHDRAIIAMLVKGMQEQQYMITTLIERITALETQ